MSRYKLRPHRLGAKTKKPSGPTREQAIKAAENLHKQLGHTVNHACNIAAWVWAKTSDPAIREQLGHFLTNIGVKATPEQLAEKAGLKPVATAPGIVLASGGLLVPGRP